MKCYICNGLGLSEDRKKFCLFCKGSGQLKGSMSDDSVEKYVNIVAGSKRPGKCPKCNGSGRGPSRCPFCKGTGYKDGGILGQVYCRDCSGTGYDICFSCKGSGKERY
jgi:DnaJ-class molecular chaperone